MTLTIHDLPARIIPHIKSLGETPPQEPITIRQALNQTKGEQIEIPQPALILTLSDIQRASRLRRIATPAPPTKSVRIKGDISYRETPLWWSEFKGGSLWRVLSYGTWKGQRCFIVGGGPSLKNFDWNLLKGEITIGINRAFEKFDPTMMFCLDPRVWGWIARGDFGEEATRKYGDFKGYKVWMNTTNFVFPDNIYVVDLSELNPCGSNTGHAAINLAMLLGANPIYLLGFDMRGDGKGHQKWFHNGYPSQPQPETVYKGFIDALNIDAPRIQKEGTSVINLTPKSALKCFPTDKIENIIRSGKRKMKPIVISYYTENSSYVDEAARLVQSIIKFGLEYDVVPKPNMGGWKANTYYKAQFIREMMNKHPDRGLLWIDADAVIMQYPALFDDLDEDIGVFVADWTKIGNYRRRLTHKKIVTDIEVLSGTIYVANNVKSRAFIDAWIALNKKNYAKSPMEQKNLQDLVFSWNKPLKILHLPPSYCQIWDTMAYLGDPVIEHFQAARRLKDEVGL